MSKICFIAGHGRTSSGSYDSGAVSKDGKFHEFQIAKKIAKFAQTYYNSYYAEQADCLNYDGDIGLSEKIKRANAGGYDFVAEIHLNAGGGTGTECYHAKSSAKGKEYATAISGAIASAFKVRNRGAKTKLTSSGTDYFGIIRQTKPVAVLVETLFIDAASDLAKINTTAGQKTCGEAIAKAVATVRGAKKKGANSAPAEPKPTGSFFPARGYFKKGDSSPNVGKIAAFMRKMFPSYTPAAALGDYYGDNLIKAIKEFQRRTALDPDGCTGPLTLKKLEQYGFKR